MLVAVLALWVFFGEALYAAGQSHLHQAFVSKDVQSLDSARSGEGSPRKKRTIYSYNGC